MNTSDRIRTLRTQKGWTQQELAEATGVDLRTIQRMESGRSISSHTLKGAAAALEVSLEALHGRSDGEPEPNPPGEFLRRITNGAELVTVIEGTYALGPSYDTPADEGEAGLISGFVGLLQDYGDTLDGLEASQRVHAVFTLQQELDTLETAGLWVFGARISRRIRLATANGDEVMTWPVAAIKIVAKTSPEIVRVRGDEKVFDRTGDTGW